MGRNRVIIGVNDLATKSPEIASQWDNEKNDLAPAITTPITFTAEEDNSSFCIEDHNIKSNIFYSLDNGKTWNKQVLAGFNDLQTRNPELASEWDAEKNWPLKPDNVTPSSGKRVWWCCSFGHSWEAMISNRAKGQGCPICHNNKILIGFNDLASKNPQLAKEWDYDKNAPLTPESITQASGLRVWWRDKFGHSWKAAVYSRTSGVGCPICANQQVLVGFNDLASKNPQLAEEWDFIKNGPLTPECVTVSSDTMAWWQDRLGHSWKASVSQRSKGTGCPFCTGKQVLAGFNDLASKNPKLAEEWDFEKNAPLTPEDVTTSSAKKVWWRDKRGHSWRAAIDQRTRGNGCPFCTGRDVLVGFNDLASLKPHLVDEWDFEKNAPLTPMDVTQNTNRRVWWKCSFGHSWKAPIFHRSKGTSCPICKNHIILPGVNDLATTSPELLDSWDFERNTFSPLENPPKISQKVWWICTNGHHWRCSVSNRQRGTGCPYCIGKTPLKTHLVP